MHLSYYFLDFFTGVLVSFISSIPLGPVGLAIIRSAIDGNFKKTVYIAAGSALMEAIYCAVAVLGFYAVLQEHRILEYIQIGSIPVLFAFGGYNLWKKVPESYQLSQVKIKNAFLQGMFLCLINPILIPYWMGMTAYLSAGNWLYNEFPYLYAYIIGVLTGTFGLMLLLGYLTSVSVIRIGYSMRVALTRIIGFVFIGFALYTLWDLIC